MTLNAAQIIAPYQSGQVLTGYAQGVIPSGGAIVIAADGTITIDTSNAAADGFLINGAGAAPVWNWPSDSGTPSSVLTSNGQGTLSWSDNYVLTVPQGGDFPQTGAAVLPAGTDSERPLSSDAGYFRFNSSRGVLEWYNGGEWLNATTPTGVVSSIVSAVNPGVGRTGDFWYDQTISNERVWDGTAWQPTTPLGTTFRPGQVQVGQNIDVDNAGIITVADTVNNVPGAVSNIGVTAIVDNTGSNSGSEALSANQGRILQLQVSALTIAGTLAYAGTLNASTGVLETVTVVGSDAGFVVGQDLPLPSAQITDYFVIVTTPGSYRAPGQTNFFDVEVGDWIFCNGTVWVDVRLGNRLPVASTTQRGVVELATDAEVQEGTSESLVITPAGLSARTATENRTGVIEIASAFETTQDTETQKAVTPNGLANRTSTEARTGLARLATQAETDAGIDDTTIVTPFKLATYISGGGAVVPADAVDVNPAINGNTDVQTVLEDAIYDVASAGGTVTVTEAATGLVNVEVTQATEAQLGGGLIATQAQVTAGTDDTTLVTPAKLATYISNGNINASEILVSPAINGNTDVQILLGDAVYDIASANNSINVTETPTGLFDIEVTQATEIQVGGAALASQIETNTGNDDTKIITPLKLNTRTSTETRTGITEIATQAEVNAGTDDFRYVTPFKLANYIGGGGGVTANDVVVSPAINGETNLEVLLQSALYDIQSTTLSVSEVATGNVTIDMPATGVNANTYTYSTVTVDAQGRITLASSGVTPNATVVAPILNTGTGVEPIIGIRPSTTTQSGAVQLVDSVNSTSTTNALTANQGNILQTQISALAISGGLINAGTFDATLGEMVTVSLLGADAGFVVGQDLPAPDPLLTDYFTIVVVGGTYSPPGGGGPWNLRQGDWIFCNGTAWVQINVGARLPYASTTEAGAVCFATPAETQAGINNTKAVTSADLQAKVSDSVALTSSTTIASSTAVKTAYDLANTKIPCSAFTVKGQLIVGTGNGTFSTLPVGTNGQYIRANSACGTGIEWVTPTVGTVTQINTGTGLTGGPITTTGTIALANTVVTPGSYTYGSFTVDQQGRLTNASSGAAPILCSVIAAKGSLIVGTAASAGTALPVGSSGQVLQADPACTTGMKWVSLPAAATYAIKNFDDISGSFNGTTRAFTLRIGGTATTLTAVGNIAVFLGGVAQTPTDSYSVAGSTITFTSAPPAGTSFYAFTVA